MLQQKFQTLTNNNHIRCSFHLYRAYSLSTVHSFLPFLFLSFRCLHSFVIRFLSLYNLTISFNNKVILSCHPLLGSLAPCLVFSYRRVLFFVFRLLADDGYSPLRFKLYARLQIIVYLKQQQKQLQQKQK